MTLDDSVLSESNGITRNSSTLRAFKAGQLAALKAMQKLKLQDGQRVSIEADEYRRGFNEVISKAINAFLESL